MATSRPQWIRARAPSGKTYEEVRSLVEAGRLHTVCQSARCPNIGECWGARTATFMILGDLCTRDCGFCAVENGSPAPIDEDEPRRVAEAVAQLGLRHAVVTSVTRDDLPDGGASAFAETIRLIRERAPGRTVEVLVPDFQGDEDALQVVLAAGPDVLNHNVETVELLYPLVRPQAVYGRSVELLGRAKLLLSRGSAGGSPSHGRMRTKSGLMVGLGETWEEIVQAMRDLRAVDCDILTLGQYLAPSIRHVPIARYYTPEEFAQLKRVGLSMGFGYVESGPLVRSSYHAEQTG